MTDKLVKSASGTVFKVIYKKIINGMTIYKLKNLDTGKETYPVLDLDVETI